MVVKKYCSLDKGGFCESEGMREVSDTDRSFTFVFLRVAVLQCVATIVRRRILGFPGCWQAFKDPLEGRRTRVLGVRAGC